jgi:dolichol kinase
MMPMSLEKRLRVRPEKHYCIYRTWFIHAKSVILPDEFVLKKYIAALTIELNILLCKFIEELIQTDTNTVGLVTTNTM